MLKRFFLIICIMFTITGCSKNCTCETVTFASWGSATETAIIKEIITDFEKENPDIKINFMHIPQNYFQKIHLLFASNTPPDVIFINNLYLPAYQKFLVPLDEYTDKNNFYKESVDAMSINNKLYAIPRDISCMLFYVNLDKAALPDSNWKIEDLLKNAPEKDKVFTISHEKKINYILPYLNYFGGGILDKEGNLIINSEKSKKALKFYENLCNKYKLAPSSAEIGSFTLAQMFIDGKIVFYLSGRWMYPKINESAKFPWAVINFPYGEKPQSLDSSGWALTKSSKHKKAALKFINYISGEKCSKTFTDTGLIVPARISTAQTLNTEIHNEKVFLEIIKHSSKTNTSKNYDKILDEINRSLDL